MSIFISVAAYCDPVLPFTLQRAVEQAVATVVAEAFSGMEVLRGRSWVAERVGEQTGCT